MRQTKGVWGDVVIALAAAVVGGLIAHALAQTRGRREHQRQQLFDLAARLGVAQLLGTQLAFALNARDDNRIGELRWQIGEQIYPILVYNTLQKFHTTELRDATAALVSRLTLLNSWSDDVAQSVHPQGALHYWQHGNLGQILIEALEKEAAFVK